MLFANVHMSTLAKHTENSSFIHYNIYSDLQLTNQLEGDIVIENILGVNEMNTMDAMRLRRSIRKFRTESVPRLALGKLLWLLVCILPAAIVSRSGLR